MKKKILVAMSGGVDSSVAAYLLQQAGWEVGGATIRTWASGDCEEKNTKSCCGVIGVEDARDVAERLEIPYHVFNFEKEFKTHVVDYFTDEYMKGNTPNPCIACNEHIKFKLFLQRARELGYDKIATGHYAQLKYDKHKQHFVVSQGLDAAKDQSYVLFPLSQDVLSHLELPVGQYTKQTIREIAGRIGLCVANKPDSQEICFIPSNDYGAFLEKQGAVSAAASEDVGQVRDKEGSVLGTHPGYYHFTIGQRKGLNIAHPHALYVIDILPEENLVIVGPKEDVYSQRCEVERINWFVPLEQINPNHVQAKIRSRHQKAEATLSFLSNDHVQVNFREPQDAITPGQACVLYDGDIVLGGGWIGRSTEQGKASSAHIRTRMRELLFA
ncbi:MAG: tRNA 2-thiouridine(34) synthase MnmA [Candidatus Omnitrophica bacterium CG11_big_fil_rev_8_21_14_0_20_45_26]|uniref:tRNA-specific 2-thiouridylase MnmA n=1 Tax=Candidatus Abzuiibacterium crystallinum TaxID=1974748 RepID=A0A2H0LM75_9BACT|nr:MAG: tRNA 2-thiouridine(34) synthase MnmA [Candidatus Omnitrophica bacterium CG11_big_fil_rev_8_21_14_0_20_45_26]PIW63723.1 MAG: tRNA 2-thiouridine(34) synthase MnmA [Candidatus Omnitrophica bacterium CG12_big_fil_rev_8_21_14_0_65_45_16]